MRTKLYAASLVLIGCGGAAQTATKVPAHSDVGASSDEAEVPGMTEPSPPTALKGAMLSGRRLEDRQLPGSDFSGSFLGDAVLLRCNLRGSVFAGADLQTASFEGSDLREADFTGALIGLTYFGGADLSTAKDITTERISGACGDAETRLPEGVTIPRCDKTPDDPCCQQHGK